MTICPKCRDEAAKVAREADERNRFGNGGPTVASIIAKEIAEDIEAIPTHPQDAETREGLADIYEQFLGPVVAAPEAIERVAARRRPAGLGLADAILAYLASQGFRRVGEGGA